MMAAIVVAAIILVFAVGLWLGFWIGVQQTREQYRDRLERIEPPPRTPGQPTNRDAPPSRVTEPKRRPGHFMS